MSESKPVQRFFAYVLMAVGGLITVLSAAARPFIYGLRSRRQAPLSNTDLVSVSLSDLRP